MNRIIPGALAALLLLGPGLIPCYGEDQAPAASPHEGTQAEGAPSGGMQMPPGHPAVSPAPGYAGDEAGAESPHGGMQMPAGHPALAPTPRPLTPEEEAKAAHGGIDIPASTKTGTTVVPDEVKGHWKAATFIVVDREKSDATEVTVPLGESWTFPDKRLRVDVIEFLPDLLINNKIYTSRSNEPNNPAAHVVIHDGDKEVFDGWLFSQFPQVHGFQHPRFGFTLKEGVPG